MGGAGPVPGRRRGERVCQGGVCRGGGGRRGRGRSRGKAASWYRGSGGRRGAFRRANGGEPGTAGLSGPKRGQRGPQGRGRRVSPGRWAARHGGKTGAFPGGRGRGPAGGIRAGGCPGSAAAGRGRRTWCEKSGGVCRVSASISGGSGAGFASRVYKEVSPSRRGKLVDQS